MRDEDDGAPLGDHGAQGGEQNVGLLWGEHRGRLIEDEHLRTAVENLQDLDALLLTDRQLPHLRTGVHRKSVSVGEFLHALLDGLCVQNEGGVVVTQHDVLGHGERGDEPEVLVHHSDAGVECRTGRGELRVHPAQVDVSFVGPVQTGEDVGQRGLPGAVLAEECVHFTGACLEFDPVVRHDAREALHDSRHPDGDVRPCLSHVPRVLSPFDRNGKGGQARKPAPLSRIG